MPPFSENKQLADTSALLELGYTRAQIEELTRIVSAPHAHVTGGVIQSLPKTALETLASARRST